MERTTLLILGASGRLGRMLQLAWRQAAPAGLRCVWQDRHAGGPDRIVWDPLGGAEVTSVLPRADAVLNLLGVTAGDPAALALNTPLALAGVEAARALGARRCLVASSAAVYGPAEAAAEGRAASPATAYGQAKAAMEAALRGAPCVTLLRIGNVAGADALLGGARPGSGPVLLDRFADGAGPVRSYIGPRDLAHVLAALAMAADLPDTLNISAPGAVAMVDLLTAARLDWRWRPAPPDAVQRVTLDTARLQRHVPLPARAADPAEIVRQWQATRRPA
jgi:nucleoside-diphosphate-sugar epimerase